MPYSGRRFRNGAGSRDSGGKAPRRRKPPAGELLREASADGLVRAAPGHPWLDPAVVCGSGHRRLDALAWDDPPVAAATARLSST